MWWNGRHDGLKIRCLVIGVRVQVPPFPIIINIMKLAYFLLFNILNINFIIV
jgi:hypothetical protein